MTGITASYCSTDSCFTVHRIHQGHYWTEEDSMFTVLSRLLTLCCYQSADAPARACLCLSIATLFKGQLTRLSTASISLFSNLTRSVIWLYDTSLLLGNYSCQRKFINRELSLLYLSYIYYLLNQRIRCLIVSKHKSLLLNFWDTMNIHSKPLS